MKEESILFEELEGRVLADGDPTTQVIPELIPDPLAKPAVVIPYERGDQAETEQKETIDLVSILGDTIASGKAAIRYKSDYVTRSGAIIGSGPVMQGLAVANIGNISMFTWGNYDLTLEQTTEVNIGIGYSNTISDNLLGGNLSGRIGYQLWNYPDVDANDFVIEGGINYSGPIDIDLSVTQILPSSEADEGTMVHSTVSKTFDITEDGSVSITPKLSSAYLLDYYGADGIPHVTPGVDITIGKGPVKGTISLNYQIGISEKVEDCAQVGFGISVDF